MHPSNWCKSVQSHVSNRSLRCLSYIKVSPIVSTIYRHYTILWCRHLQISSNGYGFEFSPAIWQTFINNILRQIPNKNRHIAIMDDCLVHSKFADHMQDLTNLFQSLIDNGLKISPRKCQFFQTDLSMWD